VNDPPAGSLDGSISIMDANNLQIWRRP
jgi:hypothetical protein